MNKVSQEGIITSLALSAGVTLLAKFAPAVVSALKQKLGEDTAGAVMKAAKGVMAASTQGDLVRFTQSARVEPILLMDKRAVDIPFIQDVVHTSFNMFTSYWLLAIALDTKINGVSVGRRLDKFATDRDLGNAVLAMAESKPSMASFGLPFVEEAVASLEAVQLSPADLAADIQKALDRITDQELKKKLERQYEEVKKTTDSLATAAAKKKLEEFFENNLKNTGNSVANAAKYVEKVNNLAVGNIIDVTISEDDKSAVVPVAIRLRVAAMPSDTLVQTLAVGGGDVTATSRWRAWRAGEIRFWADFVLAMDRVDAHRAAMMKDETGYYKAVWGRARNNAVSSAMAGGPSLGTASAIIVMTTKTASDLERTTGHSLSEFRQRQAIFGQTFSMLMFVVDPEWESVTVYVRGIEMASTFTKNDIKSAGKTDSKELMEMMKSFQMGRMPGRI